MDDDKGERAAVRQSNIKWKVIKPMDQGHIRFKMMGTGTCIKNDTITVSPPNPFVSDAGGQPQRESTSDSSITSEPSELFDRTPSNTETEDTGVSSVTSSDSFDPILPRIFIQEKPSHFSTLDHGCKSRKRVALSNLEPTTTPDVKVEESSAQSLAPPQKDVDTSDSPLTSLTSGSSSSSKSPQKKRVQHPSWRANASIPNQLSWEEYGRQCVLAANMSRLNPYALSTGEHRLLKDRLDPLLATTYLNIRNGILRLWTRNPMVSVTEEEAAGCAKHRRYFGMAVFAYRWLVRNGYINFGCVEPLRPPISPPRGRRSPRQSTIAVIGAGMAGLGCARHIENLIISQRDHWINRGDAPPKVIVLEGRKRIGGRVYSHPLRSQVQGSLPNGLRNTAEMGAQIITGFQQGNPMDTIVRGQLGVHYHLMWDEIVMHDVDGKPVDHDRDMLVNKIHNDVLERTSDFRIKPTVNETMQGNQELIEICHESPYEEILSNTKGADDVGDTQQSTLQQDRSQVVPPGFSKLQGRTQVVAGNSSSRTAAQAARDAGWDLQPGISRNHSLNLKPVVKEMERPNLGTAMDEAVRQYQHLVQLTPQDMRLLNWHYADLEYANAAMIHQLSLSGHDQDSGNEFEGRHSEVVGGYIQVPRGLMMLPHQLDVQFDAAVERISYSTKMDGMAEIECSDGEIIEADKVVLTAPLGVLKDKAIDFQPPLPKWKANAIDRLGFGLLNKIVLVFEKPFWDEKYDMFGLLNNATKKELLDPMSYAAGRGKFYLVWNCISNSGRPMLIALMSGNTAHAAEKTETGQLVKEVIARLSATFAPKPVPAPVEVIVTRWKTDPFSRGTYSFVAPGTEPGDYDTMAAPVGNLHFAGEATCGTHPATVHGAYLSGLRAAAEVVESLIGPVQVPEILVDKDDTSPEAVLALSSPVAPRSVAPVSGPRPVGRPPKSAPVGRPPKTTAPKIKQEAVADAVPALSGIPAVNPYRSLDNTRFNLNEQREAAIKAAIFSEIGERPLRPTRPGVNPFLLYTAEKWHECKAECSREKQAHTGKADAQATRNEVRTAIGANWRKLSEEEKRPWVEQGALAQQLANDARRQFDEMVARWDREAARIRGEWRDGQAESATQEAHVDDANETHADVANDVSMSG